MKTVPVFICTVLFFFGHSFAWRIAPADDTWIANRIVNFKWDQNKDGSSCNFTSQMCGPLVIYNVANFERFQFTEVTRFQTFDLLVPTIPRGTMHFQFLLTELYNTFLSNLILF